MRYTNENGFTLIELVTVILIIGIVAAVTAPNFSSWKSNLELKSAARDLYSNMQKAKLEAVKQNECIGITFTVVTYPAAGGSYVAFKDDGTGGGTRCNGTRDGAEALISTTVISQKVSLISATNIGGPAAVCFAPTSVICNSGSGNIQLRNTDRWVKLTVSAAGSMRLEKSSNGTTWSN